MKIENCKLKISNKAFTLIELLVAIAIVGILAAVVLVSMQSYAKKARASKALAQASSAIPSMVSCWGNERDVKNPPNDSMRNICSIGSSYGQWPASQGYHYETYNLDLATVRAHNGGWAFAFVSDSDGKGVCCTSVTSTCDIYDWDGSGWPSGSCPMLYVP